MVKTRYYQAAAGFKFSTANEDGTLRTTSALINSHSCSHSNSLPSLCCALSTHKPYSKKKQKKKERGEERMERIEDRV
jgi:hypothetical protein